MKDGKHDTDSSKEQLNSVAFLGMGKRRRSEQLPTAAEGEQGPANRTHFQGQGQGVKLEGGECAAHTREGSP